MDKEFFVYALISDINGHIYVGMTQCLDRRLSEHNAGKVKSTKAFTPWRRFFSILAGDNEQARKLEKYYKSAAGKKKLKQLLADSGSLPDCVTQAGLPD